MEGDFITLVQWVKKRRARGSYTQGNDILYGFHEPPIFCPRPNIGNSSTFSIQLILHSYTRELADVTMVTSMLDVGHEKNSYSVLGFIILMKVNEIKDNSISTVGMGIICIIQIFAHIFYLYLAPKEYPFVSDRVWIFITICAYDQIFVSSRIPRFYMSPDSWFFEKQSCLVFG